MKIFADITKTVGGTPLVELRGLSAGARARIVVQVESFKPLSSVKERIGVAMLDAAQAAGGQSDGKRIAAVQDQFAEVYPQLEGHETSHRSTIAWAKERYSGGGYAVPHPGQMAAFWPVIRSGTGRIRFAGEHTEALAGYMESAIRSGHRIAKELGSPEN